MPSQVQFSIRDRTNEYSSVSLNIPQIDETTYVATQTQIAAIQTALAAMTLGSLAVRTLVAERVTVDDTQPTSPFAQRELGLRFFCQEDVAPFKKFHFTVAAPDLNIIDVGDKDVVDVENVTVANALATAVEAACVSPDGRTFEIYRAKLVGRRN
jgi:hypothetical protein